MALSQKLILKKIPWFIESSYHSKRIQIPRRIFHFLTHPKIKLLVVYVYIQYIYICIPWYSQYSLDWLKGQKCRTPPFFIRTRTVSPILYFVITYNIDFHSSLYSHFFFPLYPHDFPIFMVIFHSYVSLPKGISCFSLRRLAEPPNKPWLLKASCAPSSLQRSAGPQELCTTRPWQFFHHPGLHRRKIRQKQGISPTKIEISPAKIGISPANISSSPVEMGVTIISIMPSFYRIDDEHSRTAETHRVTREFFA